MKDVCYAKYNQEASEQAYILIQKQIQYYNSPNQSLENSSLAHLDIIESLEDPELRCKLNQPLKDIAEQTRYQLLIFDEEITREEMTSYKTIYEDRMDQFRETYSMSSNNSQSFLLMINLIEQRCSKIAERIQCIYRYKTRCIGTKAYI